MANGWRKRRIAPQDALRLGRRLLREVLVGNFRLFLWAWLWVGAAAATTAGLALATRYLVDSVMLKGQGGAIWLATSAIVVLSLAKGVSTYFQTTTAAAVNRTLLKRFQIAQFEKMVGLELGYFGGRHASKFVSDVLFAARGTASATLIIMNDMVRDALTLIFLGGVMVSQDPAMSLATLFLVPLLAMILAYVTRRIRKLSLQQAPLTADLAATATETIEGMKVVKSFGLEERALAAFRTAVDRLERSALEINRTAALTSPALETLGGIMIGLFILYASWQSAVNARTPGEFVAFISAFLFAYQPAKRLAGVHVELQKQLAAVAQYYELLDRPALPQIAAAGAEVTIARGDIRVGGVSFAYGKKQVLHDVSFEIAHGERIALVGRSGSGKTTLANMLLGFVKPDSGQVLIDGADVAGLSYESLRRATSLIAQESFLFDGTIGENIRDGRPDAPAEDVQRAAEAAEVMAFAHDLPAGLDSPVGSNGSNLSGGQRQRISIARGLLKPAPVLIFDEPTAALDGASEQSIISAVLEGPRDRTVLCISHRYNTIRNFDRAIVLEKGVIVDDGPLHEVERRCDLFRRVFGLGDR